jgi:hypothetical protein
VLCEQARELTSCPTFTTLPRRGGFRHSAWQFGLDFPRQTKIADPDLAFLCYQQILRAQGRR